MRVRRACRVVEDAVAAQHVDALPAKVKKAARAKSAALPHVVANTTDPQSRIMLTRKGFLEATTTQVAVTADQLIVAVQWVSPPRADRGAATSRGS